MNRPKIATAWLDGCSGCHMSLLDMDEKIIDLVQQVDIVCSPTMDIKEFPKGVDVTLVEGAVSSSEDLHKIQRIRERTRLLISLGDCAVTGNVPSMRNMYDVATVGHRAYVENATTGSGLPARDLPPLLPKVRPIHECVKVDLFVPGCPPPAEAIVFVLTELLAGRIPDPGQLTRFGK